jgi:hypothetical protein
LPAYRVLGDEVYVMEATALAEEAIRKNEQICTYINLSITMDPEIELPNENNEAYYPGGESP